MKKIIRFLMLTAVLLGVGSACADLVLPSQLEKIDSEAFSGCDALEAISIPSSVQSVGVNAFADSETPLLIYTPPGSAAMSYALENNLDFDAGTTYRALLVAQCNYTGNDRLEGTLSDMHSMNTILSAGAQTSYQVKTMTDLTADGILQAIGEAFAQAQEQDVSLFYYSGHGSAWNGALFGIDEKTVSPSELRECLDKVPGRKIVIVDACHSGALIGKSVGAGETADPFVSAFLRAFAQKSRSNLAADRYYVMTAAHSTQTSVEIIDGFRHYGAFTTSLAKGCGYDFPADTVCERYADTNEDGVITFEEAFRYARIEANTYNAKQTAQVWPEDCSRFGFLR